MLGYMNYAELVRRGYVPLKDKSYLTNGYLDTPLDWIRGMKNIRLRDIPSFIQTTDPDDIMLNINIMQSEDDAPVHSELSSTRSTPSSTMPSPPFVPGSPTSTSSVRFLFCLIVSRRQPLLPPSGPTFGRKITTA
uniref:Uncharacterized protein n=1 Tax=Ananas comosus var. bracteatus TaxID=296719 RepID=A0A6V7QVI0_ANACO